MRLGGGPASFSYRDNPILQVHISPLFYLTTLMKDPGPLSLNAWELFIQQITNTNTYMSRCKQYFTGVNIINNTGKYNKIVKQQNFKSFKTILLKSNVQNGR